MNPMLKRIKILVQTHFRLANMERKWIFPLAMASLVSLFLVLVATLVSVSNNGVYPVLSYFRFKGGGNEAAQAVFVESKISSAATTSMASLPPPPRLAYLISGSRGDGQRLVRTLRALYHPLNQYVVHLDLESSPRERVDLALYVKTDPIFSKVGNVHMITKANLITYRGPTMVANTLHAAAILLKKSQDWDWFINLSASDYPLVTQGECPVGTYKDVDGSDAELCLPCPPKELPYRAEHIYVRGGVTQSSCPYKCISEKYRMPLCYTPLEELIYTFGGPWLFGLLLSGLLVLLALVLSVARMKFVGSDDHSVPTTPHESQIQHSFPFFQSIDEVREINRAEESQSHVHRMYFMGPNNFGEPWHLPHSPPDQITQLVYEDAFNRFVDEINSLAAYQWWEGSVYSILSVLAYPFAWSWQQWRRRKKVQRLRKFVRSEYDHACLRSCRSRALYEGLKVAATPDLIVAYVDFFLGGDEKRSDLPPRLQQRFPMCIIFGGDGSYMAPYYIHSDNLLTNLLGQAIPATVWYRFVAGLNAQLRTVRQGCIRSTLLPVIEWLGTHANPCLRLQGTRVDLGWFQATLSGYYQLGLLINAADEVSLPAFLPDIPGTVTIGQFRENNLKASHNSIQWQGNQQQTARSLSRRRIGGGIINAFTLQSLEYRKDLFFPLSLILHNTRPAGYQDLVGLITSVLLLGDFSLMLLTLLQFYSISLGAFFAVLLILPLALLSPFPAGINALFSHGQRRSAGLARVYALWNVTSLVNVVVALICAFLHYRLQSSYGGMQSFHSSNSISRTRDHQIKTALPFSVEEGGWWIFPTALLLCKCVQARMVDWHIANLEIQDYTLYSSDPAEFWES